MKRVSLRLLAPLMGLVAASSVLQGCEQTREAFGLTRNKPDEFAVVTRAPLELPPDYALRPPAPGAPRPQEQTAREAARTALLRPEAAPAASAPRDDLSRGEQALLARAGADRADPDIRAKIDRETAALAEADFDLVQWMMFWKPKEPPGVVVDAEKEAQRLRETAALGQSPATGRTPVIERRRGGLFN